MTNAAGPHDERRVADAAELDFGPMFDQTLDGVVVATPEGKIRLWNPAASRMFGYTREEALDMDVADLVPEHLRTAHRAGIERFQRTDHGAFIDRGTPLELPALHRDGHLFYIDLTLSRIEEHGSRYVMAIVRDVDARVRLRQDVARRQMDLEDVNKSLEAFGYVVAHDLKEPVRAMGAMLEDVVTAETEAERSELVKGAQVAQRNLARLLDGLMEWSSTAAAPLEPEPLRVSVVLRDPGCAEQYRSLLEERHATLEIASDLPIVMATESLLCRLFGNLVTNAIRHNTRGTPLVRIARGQSAPPGFVEILVDDNGPGFSSAAREKLRDIKHGPTSLREGFGLAIAYRALTRLGGELYLDNAPGGGGRARVHLPAPPERRRRTTLEDRVRELV